MRATLRLGMLFGMLALGLGAMANEVRHVRVQFEHGASSATIQDDLTGAETVQYVVQARAGQRLHVSFQPAGPDASFTVFLPGAVPGRDPALFIGETSGNTLDTRLSHSGDHLIQVFQGRNAARRGERVAYTLTISITGGVASHGAGGTATVVVTHPTGRTHASFFEHECLTGADSGQTEGDPRLTPHSEAGLSVLRIGTERDEIPDAAVLGG
jgi:hypothetical protein